MNKLKLALTSLVVLGANSAYAATVSYDAADITGTITNIQTTAVAVMGAFITLGLTVMFYRKIRGLASRGQYQLKAFNYAQLVQTFREV